MSVGPVRLLLVEDTQEDALLLRATLESAEDFAFELTQVERLTDAERVLARREFDAVLLDLSLPDSHGLETVHRALRTAPAAPIVILTGSRDEQVALEAMQGGAQDYLVKRDLGAALLTRTIRHAIERKRREIEYRREAAERRLAEEALQRSEAYFRSLIDNAIDLITVVDEAGVIRYESPSVKRALGFLPEELVGRSFLEFTHPDDVPRMRAMLSTVIEHPGDRHAVELRFRTVGGAWRVLEGVAVNLLHDPAVRAIVANTRDVTESREAQAQLDAYTRELERSNRALQEFAYVASHDLQEPLRKIRTFGDRLRSRFGAALGEQGADYVDRMQNAAARMQTLIEDLLTYSRVTTKGQAFCPVDLERLAEEVVSDLSQRVEQTDAEVRVEGLPTIEADAVQMRQLLQNLIANALKFHRPGVRPEVLVQGRSTEAGVEIRVRDNGIGFDPQYAERIFSPFQRLHGRGEYEGTGMGLAICRKIVDRHGGDIEARGAPGGGAEFWVRLPVRDSGSEGA